MQVVDDQPSLAKLTKALQESNRHLRLLTTSKRERSIFIDLHVDGNPSIGRIEGSRDSLDLDHTARFGRHQNCPRLDRQLFQVDRMVIDHRLAGDLRQGDQHRSSGAKRIPAPSQVAVDWLEMSPLPGTKSLSCPRIRGLWFHVACCFLDWDWVAEDLTV